MGSWKREDFFSITADEEVKVKKRLAQLLQIRYGSVQQDKAFACPVSGVQPYTLDGIKQAQQDLMEAKRQLAADPQNTILIKEAKNKASIACVVSGLQINWRPLKPVNRGYILDFADKKVPSWDSTLERRAGGLDSSVPLETQHLAVTSVSSCLALILSVVHAWKQGLLDAADKTPETECLITAFKSIRVNLEVGLTADEIGLVNELENLEQAERKRHGELDNILTVASWRKSAFAHTLNGDSCLDVFKYAAALSDAKSSPPPWVLDVLGGKPDTFENRLAGLKSKNKAWLTSNKVAPLHVQMNSYANMSLRHRFLRGFSDDALVKLQSVASQMGERGLANKAFPISRAVLLGSSILSSNAFIANSEKASVPSWRNAADFPLKLAVCLEKRYFEHLVPAGPVSGDGKAAFISDKAWASFTRLINAFETLLETEFGPMSGWDQSVSSVYRQLWTGDLDAEVAKLSDGMSEIVDSNKQLLLGRVKEFPPIARLLSCRELQGANVKMQTSQEVQKIEEPENKGASPADALMEGDVTAELAPHKTAAEKKQLCDKLNAEALKARNKEIEECFGAMGAECFRTKAMTFKSTAECKNYMQSSVGGIVARTILVDFTMPDSLQAGPKNRLLAKAPSKDYQKQMAAEINTIPMRPVIGHVLARGVTSLETFDLELEGSHGYKRSIMVPVEVPEEYMRYIRSATSRSHGPTDDLSSGIDFVMYTVGRQRAAGGSKPADADGGDQDDEEEEAQSGAVLSVNDCKQMPAEQLSFDELQQVYGESADDIAGLFFQHSSRLASTAKFLRKEGYVMIQVNDRTVAQKYRKAQLDPSVFFSAFTSCLSTCSSELSSNEALVILTGGTPETIVAGIAAGYRKILYVSNSAQQHALMELPTVEAERAHNINYAMYSSPDPENPLQGVLAAAAVTKVANCMRDWVQKPGVNAVGLLKIEPPADTKLPPLRQYEFWAVTGQIQSRTIDPEAETLKKQVQVQAKATPKKPAPTETKPVAPSPTGSVEVGSGTKRKKKIDQTPANNDTDGEDEEEEEEEQDAELGEDALQQALKSLEASQSKAKGKAKGRPRKSAKGSKGSKVAA